MLPTKSISIAASIEGTHQELQPLIDRLKEIYIVSDIEYGSNKDVVWIKCKTVIHDGVKAAQELLELAATDQNIKIDDILDWRLKPRRCVISRDIICLILYKKYNMTSTDIAELLKAKSHKSVLLACKKFDKIDFFSEIESLTQLYVVCKAAHGRCPYPGKKK